MLFSESITLLIKGISNIFHIFLLLRIFQLYMGIKHNNFNLKDSLFFDIRFSINHRLFCKMCAVYKVIRLSQPIIVSINNLHFFVSKYNVVVLYLQDYFGVRYNKLKKHKNEIKIMLTQNLSKAEIARRMNCSWATLSRFIKQLD